MCKLGLSPACGQPLCVAVEHGRGHLPKNSSLLEPNCNVVWNLRERNSNKTPDLCSAWSFSSGEPLRWERVRIWCHGSHEKPISLSVPPESILQVFPHLCDAGGQPLPSLILQGNSRGTRFYSEGPSSKVVGYFRRMFSSRRFSLFMTLIPFPGVIFLSNGLSHFAPQKRVKRLRCPNSVFSVMVFNPFYIYLHDINVRFFLVGVRVCVVRK